MEMLIVVAIMVVLMAVAIPIFSSQINKAKESVDNANLRTAKQLAHSMYLLKQEDFETEMYYDIVNDTYITTEPPAYGQVDGHSVISALQNVQGNGVIVQWE